MTLRSTEAPRSPQDTHGDSGVNLGFALPALSTPSYAPGIGLGV